MLPPTALKAFLWFGNSLDEPLAFHQPRFINLSFMGLTKKPKVKVWHITPIQIRGSVEHNEPEKSAYDWQAMSKMTKIVPVDFLKGGRSASC